MPTHAARPNEWALEWRNVVDGLTSGKLLVRDRVVRRLVCGSVEELIVVPACDRVIGRGVGDLRAKRIVHDALRATHVEGDDVVLSRGIELAGIPLEDDPLGCT